MANKRGKSGSSDRFYFLGLQNHHPKFHGQWLQPWNEKTLALWKKSYANLDSTIQKQRHYFANKGPDSHSYDFSSSHAKMWKLICKESWMLKNGCFWIVVLEKTPQSPFDSKEIKPVTPKGNQPWIFMEGLMLKLKLQYFDHLMGRAGSLEKTLMLRKIEGKRRRGWHRMR